MSNAPQGSNAAVIGAAAGPVLSPWLGVASVAVGTFVLVTTEFLPVGLLPQVARDLGVSDGTAGLMVTMPGLVATLAAPAVMVAAGRLDRRIVLWVLSTLLIASNLLAALAPNILAMLAGRMLLGVSVGGFWSIAVGLGARLVPEPAVGRANAVILAGISFGTVVGVPTGALIGELAGWRTAFAAVGLLSLLVLIAQLILLPSLPSARAIRPRDLLSLLDRRNTRVGLLIVVLIASGQFAAYTYVTPFLQRTAGLDAEAITLLLLGYGLAGLIGNFAAGASVTRNLRGTLLGVAAVMGLAMVSLPVIGTAGPGAVAALLVWGIAFGAVPISLNTWMFKAAGDVSEGGSALYVSTFQICIAFGALLGGAVVDGNGPSGAMWTGGAFVLLSIPVIGLLTRTHRGLPVPG